MKSSIIKLNAAPARKSKTTGSSALISIESDINRLWEMYQSQLKRNTELLTIIDRQQQFIQQFINTNSGINLIPSSQQPPPAPVSEFKNLDVATLFQYSQSFKQIFTEIKRLDGIQTLISFLYTIKHSGGALCPAELFEKTNVAKSTGFRNVTFLLSKKLIKRTGNRYDFKYEITKYGNQFLDGTLDKDYEGNKFQLSSKPTPKGLEKQIHVDVNGVETIKYK